MATGRSIQLTKQVGENLVVAELGRRGFIASTFAGNVPDFDILASDPSGKTFPIQVKAIQGSSWQFDVRKFIEIELVDKIQVVKGKKMPFTRDLVCVFVRVLSQHNDEFYILHWGDLQDYFNITYKGGQRPRNPKSFHCAIWPKDLLKFKDNWDMLNKSG